MKKVLRAVILPLVLCVLMTTAVRADSGPKPQLVVRVEHPPKEGYYLDLLDEGNFPRTEYDTDEEGLDKALLEQLRAAIPDGWHGCISEGSTRAPIWGDLTGEAADGGVRVHTFRYVGVPQTYRILMVSASGEIFLSDVLTRETLQSAAAVDWAAKTVRTQPVYRGYALQFLATFVPTLVIEFALLLLFGFSLRENWKTVLLVNLVTQGLLHACFAWFALQSGVSWFYFLLFFPAEAAVTLIESCIYRMRLLGRSRRRAFFYGVCANVCSAALGYFLAEPVWRFAVSLG